MSSNGRRTLIIGREQPADIIVPVPQVSARHASLVQLDPQTFLIKDLDSMNGIFVNRERVASSVIRPPDEVSLGSIPLQWAQILSAVEPSQSSGQPTASGSELDPIVASRGVPDSPPPAAKKPDPPVQVAPPVVVPASPQGQPLSRDLAAALASNKTYGTKAFFVWFLYWLGWLPGCVMNIVYLSEANGIKRNTGVSPSGRGCLVFLLVTHVILPIVAIVVLFAIGGTAVTALLSSF